MFGYVIVNKQELKFKEFDRYRSYYCGLCHVLKEAYGSLAQFSLSYDMAFVIMLLTALYEPETREGSVRCLAHPLEKHPVRENRFTEYAADLDLFLTFKKCADDWKDEKKAGRKAYSIMLKRGAERVAGKYPEKTDAIDKRLNEIDEFEKRRENNIDLPAGAFGEIMAEVLSPYKDEWETELRRIGFYLGKFVYIMDAFDDLEKDRKSGNYNPFILREQQASKETPGEGGHVSVADIAEAMLVMMMSECCRAFERLPIVDRDVDILRNILYSGVWCRFTAIRLREKEKQKNESI